MKLGAYFLPEDFDVYLESVRAAEEAGYERAWLIDGQMLYHDTYVYMTHGLAATERLVFGTGVTNPLTRHFTVTANVLATLADLHPGRAILGLGRGDNAVRTLGLNPVPTKRLSEVVPKLRALMAGREIDFDGTPVRIRWARGGVPIMLAATGPKNLRVAGSIADIVQLQIGVNPVAVRWAIEQVRGGAEEAGRDPAEVEISLICGMWIDGDLDEARRACRWAAPSAANHLEDVMRRNPAHGMPEELTRVVEARRSSHVEFDYYRDHGDSTADEMDWLTDDLVDDFAIAGPPERCLEQIRALAALGVEEIATAFLNGQLDQMETVGRDLRPSLLGSTRGS